MRHDDDLVGSDLGRYHLTSLAGQGGMARVYIARLVGDHGFEKQVAVKVLHPEFAGDPRLIAMFIDEVRVASRLQHTNICSVFDFGTHQGAPYLVMEYLQGLSLSQLLKQEGRHRAIPPRYAARIIADAARGLHAAHELVDDDGHPLGVIHRDVSPQNIFILEEGAVKVLDFGIAKMRGRLTVTRAHEIKGKVAYMAPEQIGGGDLVDRRVDVWALGVVLWEATVGRRLFLAEDFNSTMGAVLRTQVPRPGDVSPKAAPLDEIIMSALERDPERRIPTATELADELERYLFSTGEPTGPTQLARFLTLQPAREPPLSPRDQSEPSTIARVEGRPAERAPSGARSGPPPEALVDETSDPELLDPTRPLELPEARRRPTTPAPLLDLSTTLDMPNRGRPPRADRSRALLLGVLATFLLATIALVVAVAVILWPSPEPALTTTTSEPAGWQRSAEAPLVDVSPRSPITVETRPAPQEPAAEARATDASTEDEAGPGQERGLGDASADPAPAASTTRVTRPGARPSRPGRPAKAPREPPPPRPPPQPPEERGALNLLVIPRCQVQWQGRDLGRTPLFEVALPPGSHTLTLRPVGGGEGRTINVVIRPGQTTRRSIRLE